MTHPLHERTYDSPDGDAAARLAQMVAMSATLAEAVARLQANRTADRADTDERAAAAARAGRVTEHAAARVAWSPARTDDWLYRATTPDLVRAWSAATTWAASDPDATHTAARLDTRLRQLQPDAMTAYDQARSAGADPAPAMHAAAQHFTYPLPPPNRTTAVAVEPAPRAPREVAADAYPHPARDGVTARARVHLITTANAATPTAVPAPPATQQVGNRR
jgi:hypothetical protein